MKKLQLIYVFMLMIFFLSCKKEKDEDFNKPKSTSVNKIMPLGASRVEGATPNFESYRYELWKKLENDSFAFDYIGTRIDRGSYPKFNNKQFDTDHEGRGGWKSSEILENINTWLESTGSPDILLFSSPGGNDILNGDNYDGMISNVEAIINNLQINNPNVSIIIEMPAPGKSNFMTQEYIRDFEKLRTDVQNLAKEKTTPNSKVIAVDMYTGFTDDMLADEVHYNQAGAQFIAQRYFDVLKEILVK